MNAHGLWSEGFTEVSQLYIHGLSEYLALSSNKYVEHHNEMLMKITKFSAQLNFRNLGLEKNSWLPKEAAYYRH